MADLLEVLPDFDVKPFSHLIYSLQKNDITVADLISLDPVEVARKCPLPLLDVRRLVADVIEALQRDLQISTIKQSLGSELLPPSDDIKNKESERQIIFKVQDQRMVKTLDSGIDKLLGGGFLLGHISEIVGESAVGKTQFVLGLLLSVQLPPPLGLGKGAIYLTTESRLGTRRLAEILAAHTFYQDIPLKDRPSLDNVHITGATDLEMQQHLIDHQLPLAIDRYNVGLVVMDSVAANFRAEHETRTPAGLADRATTLTKLGSTLRRLAVERGVAVVVTNQVSDRFDDSAVRMTQERLYSSSPALSSSPASQRSNMPPPTIARRNGILSLDHQQRFFTGWGDKPGVQHEEMKTPALGLAWANQISARVVLKMEGERPQARDYTSGNIWKDTKKRRFASVVFAPWVEPSLKPLEYEIMQQGISSIRVPGEPQAPPSSPNPELLADELWADDDDEFP